MDRILESAKILLLFCENQSSYFVEIRNGELKTLMISFEEYFKIALILFPRLIHAPVSSLNSAAITEFFIHAMLFFIKETNFQLWRYFEYI